MSNKSGTSSQVISLPQGGGALHGIGEKFSPDLHTGTGNFTIPIALPPGRNGFQPQLNLVYSTGNGNGIFGLGWSLSIPGVSRKTSEGIPRYEDQNGGSRDTFVLSGAEDLVPIERQANFTHYRPRTEGLFARIIHCQDAANNYWEVRSKDGLTSLYGTPDASGSDSATITNPVNHSQVFAWKLTRTTDPFGNRIDYLYERDAIQTDGSHQWDQLYLSEIRYVDYDDSSEELPIDRNNPRYLVRVKFIYEDRPDSFSEYRSGFEIRTIRRCTRIEISTHADRDRLLRTYYLAYLDQQQHFTSNQSLQLPRNGASLLSQVWVEGHDKTHQNLLSNYQFEMAGPNGSSTTFTGLGGAGYSAADNWVLWASNANNTPITIQTELLPSTFPGGGTTMIRVNTTGGGGLVQVFLPQDTGPNQITASAWVFVKRGRIGLGTGNGGNTHVDVFSSTTGRWEYIQAPNGVSPANELIIYSASEGGAEFYVADTCVSETLTSEWLPPLEFRYSQFEPEGRDFFPVTGADLPSGSLARSEYELADLFGNGLPDILEMNGTVRYWRNLGNGRFDRPREMRDAPGGLQLADAGVQLIDADGDGRIDLMVTREGLSGYFPLRFSGLWDRRSFQRYDVAPSFNLEDPEVKLVDLTGDGVTDAIRSGSRLECFFNDPKHGWTETRWVERQSLENFPNINFSDPRVKWGDMTGDGLQDIVLIYDGNIEYYPNLGYGNWGRRISMHNSPRFRYGYDPKRILVGDVDGDGLADIVYVDDRKVILWINQSGNGWSDPIEIKGTPPVSDMDGVRLVDLLGSGISGVLWSTDANGLSRSHLFFLDFTGGVKPYLLNEMNNHMGAVTRIGYTPSTRFYLEDEQRPETRWKTPLPFPVQVVARVEVIDQISGGKLTTEYRYHHGYWDGVEREFRGFGRVEQRDTEVFEDFNADGLHPDRPFESIEVTAFSPPLETRTWFHLGPVGDEFGDWEELDYSEEFWSGDLQVLSRPQPMQDWLRGLPRRVKRDALRTLRGNVLRTEVYALDGTERQDRPYTITESLHGVREESPPNVDNATRKHLFFPFPLAERTTQWERGSEPMTQFKFMGEYDRYGQLLSQMSIAVPRGLDFRVMTADSEPYLATYAVTTFAQRDDAQRYIVDRVARTTSYEILNDGSATVFQLWEAVKAGTASQQLIGQTLSFYDGAEFQGLPFRQLGDYGALVRSETLVLTPEILQEAYKSGDGVLTPAELPPYLVQDGVPAWTADYPAEFRNQCPALAGYVYHSDGEGSEYATGYFVVTERRRYDFQADPTQHRGLVSTTRDPLGQETTITYDAYQLLPIEAIDPAGLRIRASYNYRVLQPAEVIDPNGNRTAYRFTPLGLLASTAVMGKAEEIVGDTLAAPGIRLVYDFLAFDRLNQPIAVRSIRRVHHVNDADIPQLERDETIESVEYSDGFGRLLQTRTQAEDLTFGDPIFGDAGLPVDQTQNGDAVGQQRTASAPVRVVVSGWQVYDNKGRVVEKFEPFFSTDWDYVAPLDEQRGQKVRMHYDPRGQVIRTVNPDGSEQRVIYGIPVALADLEQFTPTPWEAYTYDGNDNAGRTHSTRSTGYQHHWNTPSSIVIDALGRTIEAVERNRKKQSDDSWSEIEEYRTRSTYDIRGNLLTVTDALDRLAFRYFYDLTPKKDKDDEGAKVLRIEQLDAGIRRVVFDAIGNEVERRDSKGALILHAYDQLNRPIRLWAGDGVGQVMTLRQRLIYGDSPDTGLTQVQAQRANLLGKPYKHYDEAGLVTVEAYDFKGNGLEKIRQVISDAAILQVFAPVPVDWQVQTFRVDWQPADGILLETHVSRLLDATPYRTSIRYDALNRVKQMYYPQDVEGNRKELRPDYNRAGALERIALDGQTYVERIAYNAKGQRTLIAYGNGIMTRYAYDPQTFRLVRMRSERYTQPDALTYRSTGALLQDFAYMYDLAGNILSIQDRTPASGILNNPNAMGVTEPQLARLLAEGNALIRQFEYDPLYRLLSATGRECDIPPESPPWADQPRCADLTRTRAYTERYQYDPVGNMERLQHRGDNSGFTREFALVANSNRLATLTVGTNVYSYTYDANGNMSQEGLARHFEWDHSDRMRVYRAQTGNAEPSVHAHYLYDASGQRVKKLVRKQGGQIEITVYVDEVFEYQRLVQGSTTQENNTLHVMDNQSRIALIRVGRPSTDDATPSVKYHLGDHLGSSNLVIDDSGSWVNREEFTPYGETGFGSFARKRYRFTSQERDGESELCYHKARYYMPCLARWLSPDSAGIADGVNLYHYAHSSPLQFIDPSGQTADEAAQRLNNMMIDLHNIRVNLNNLHSRLIDYEIEISSAESAANTVGQTLIGASGRSSQTAQTLDTLRAALANAAHTAETTANNIESNAEVSQAQAIYRQLQEMEQYLLQQQTQVAANRSSQLLNEVQVILQGQIVSIINSINRSLQNTREIVRNLRTEAALYARLAYELLNNNRPGSGSGNGQGNNNSEVVREPSCMCPAPGVIGRRSSQQTQRGLLIGVAVVAGMVLRRAANRVAGALLMLVDREGRPVGLETRRPSGI